MANESKFEIRFDPDALKEYEKLDGSVVEIVDGALEELEKRADEVGKKLNNTNESKLAGCKEIKLRNAGVRIVFRITDQIVNVLRIVYILTIEERDKRKAFKLADRRLTEFKKMPVDKLLAYLEKTKSHK